ALNVALLPDGFLPTREGKAVLLRDPTELWFLLGYLNSSTIRSYVRDTCGLHKQSGAIGRIPISTTTPEQRGLVADAARSIWRTLAEPSRFDETARWFDRPSPVAVDGKSEQTPDLQPALRTIDEVVRSSFGISPDSAWLGAYAPPHPFL